MKEKYDVAIVGVGVGANYGSVLTYYSLYKTIEAMGKKPLMVSKIGARANDPEIRDTHALRFAKRHYNLSKIYSQSSVSELNDLVDTFVIGSDQVWNYGIARGFGNAFYLDFAAENKRKISYAASFGHSKDFTPEDKRENVSALFKRFNAISVREDSGVSLAQKYYGITAKQVAEPIFLLSNDEYLRLASESNKDTSGEYLLAYILDPTSEKRAAILHLAQKMGLDVKIVLDGWPNLFEQNLKKIELDEYVQRNVETYDFLKLYANSSFVVTDSFHGTSFAVKFKKPFASIGNKRRGVVRFDSLFRLLGNRERFTLDANELITKDRRFISPIDYVDIDDVLNRHVLDSKKWLNNALEMSVENKVHASNALGGEGLVKSIKVAKTVAGLIKKPVQNQSFSISKPKLMANSDLWSINASGEFSTARIVKPKDISRGKFIWCNLPEVLQENCIYELSIAWWVKTSVKSVNIHLQDPGNKKFIVLGEVSIGDITDQERTDTIEFQAPNKGHYSQIMLGAIHFRGENAGFGISKIEIKSVKQKKAIEHKDGILGKRKMSLPAKNVPKAGMRDGSGKKMAVPDSVPTREEIIQSVRKSSIVKTWSEKLKKEQPYLNFYIAREIKEYVWNRVGGPADILVFPKSIEQVQSVIEFCRNNSVPYTVLGKGSNILVRDGGIRGIVILTTELNYFKMRDSDFIASSGARLIEAAYYLLDKERSGLEWASGIPGTIGGAVYMNAGTYTGDIRRILKSVKILDCNGEVFELQQKEIDWGVRYTSIQDNKGWIILEATFNTQKGNGLEMSQKMLKTVQSREDNMPLESPNHGSTFKWYRAPRLIEQAGLVGKRIGGVKISQKQPGFFINVKQATASDYEALINYTIAKVYEFSGFLLEPEVEIIGEFPYRYKRYPKGK